MAALVVPGVFDDEGALAIVTAVLLGLNTYELVWWREARAQSRSVLASS